jgi:hypothetical protein
MRTDGQADMTQLIVAFRLKEKGIKIIIEFAVKLVMWKGQLYSGTEDVYML